MAKQFWIRESGRVDGPFSKEQLQRIAEDGQVFTSAEISMDGEDFHPATSVRGLRTTVAASTEGSGEFDVFICYRRANGRELSMLLKEKLERAGYQVFLDVEGLSEGSWSAALHARIEECPDFIPIITEGFFNNCHNQKDVVRKELLLAAQLKRNIVPLLVAPSPFPSDLPRELEEIPDYNGVKYDQNYADACIEKLRRMLRSGRSGLDRLASKQLAPKIIVGIVGAVWALSAMGTGGFSTMTPQGVAVLLILLGQVLMSLVWLPPIIGVLFGASMLYKISAHRLYCSRDWIVFWLLYLPTVGLLGAFAVQIGGLVGKLLFVKEGTSVYWGASYTSILATSFVFLIVSYGLFLTFLLKRRWWRLASWVTSRMRQSL